MTKALIIVKPGCREPVNEFLNRISVYAAALKLGAEMREPAKFLRLPLFNNALGRMLYAPYARYLDKRHGAATLRAWRPPVFLPPTAPLPPQVAEAEAVYLFGWLYRNPAGLHTYRAEILKKFVPSVRMQSTIERILTPLRGKHLIGVQIRTRPFAGFPDGEFLVSPERTRRIVDEYLAAHNLTRKDVTLAVVSDNHISPDVFDGYKASFIQDRSLLGLYLLAACAVVIGDNSTLGNVAAWWGNTPHIVTTETAIEWEYYKDRTHYFENKYATFAQ